MPTESMKTILDRDISKVLAKDVIECAVPLLTELVNDGTNVFARCLGSSKGERGENEPVLLSYLHIVEMVDAIQVLVAEACYTPAAPLLRSAFEALVAIEYMLKRDYSRRSTAYLVFQAHHRMDRLDLLDPDTEKGRRFYEDMANDEALKHIDLSPLIPYAREEKKKKRIILGTERYSKAEEEYQRLKPKHWYKLFNGPANLRDLADQVGYRAKYDYLYRAWSAIAHGGGISRFKGNADGERVAIKPIRNMIDDLAKNELATTASFAVWIILEAKNLVLAKFHPGEEDSTKRWYLAEIRERYLSLLGLGKQQ